MGGDCLQFSKIAVYILKELRHTKLKHGKGKVLIYLPLNGIDEGEALDNTFLGGGESKEVFQALVLEVGAIQGPEGRVDVKVAANRDGETRVMEMGGHGTNGGRGWRVRVKGMGINGDIHQCDGTWDGRARECKGERKGERKSVY